MVNFFDTTFYDKESTQYSGKRYDTRAASYVQFFFQRRLKHILDLVGKYRGTHTGQVLVEDGCADGVVAQVVYEKYPAVFSKVIGTDISPGMIHAARGLNKKETVEFCLKSDLASHVKADVLLAVGFVSPGIFEDEFSFIRKHLNRDGIVIMSLVAKNSIHSRLKLRGKEILKDYLSFSEYESVLKKDFTVIDKVSYGFFVPKLWAVPSLARILQPIFEVVGKVTPSLFHETLYVLKQKG